jgi:hypothetical protein
MKGIRKGANTMKEKEGCEEMLEEYDFSQGEKGRYFTRY